MNTRKKVKKLRQTPLRTVSDSTQLAQLLIFKVGPQ